MNSPSQTNVKWFTFASSAVIFVSAFLLFLVQPMAGRMILPWFGGSPAVWTTCMVFFQTMLLAGYTYAALLGRIKRPTLQVAVHLTLLGISLFFLPINPNESWKPIDGEYPTMRILAMLIACLGFPYFVLSSTSTLIQSWFAAASRESSPYRLYALSNVGSLGALLIYPWLIEPMWSTSQQGRVWSMGFISLTIGIGFLGLLLRGLIKANNSKQTNSFDAEWKEPAWPDRAVWVLLPALSSMMLLGVTNYVCQDVAVIPFLWIAPLIAYLVSHIICFDSDQWYRREWFSVGTIASISIVIVMSILDFLQRYNGNRVAHSTQQDIRFVIGAYLVMFFMVCMICHGETVRRRPASGWLSQFYLSIAAGSVIGSFLVAIVCPVLFSTFAEFNIGILMSLILAIGILVQSLFGPLSDKTRQRIKLFAISLTASLLFLSSDQWFAGEISSKLPQVRNFYGTMSVRELSKNEPEHRGLALFHGSTMHGFQHTEPTMHNRPTAYFTEDSGIGIGLRAMQQKGPLNVGVVGLGIGTLAAYGRPGDTFRFYEINPLVVRLAEQNFTFLQSSAAKVEIVAGDARLALDREESQQFDVLILDAFSSDAVPIHLLTSEALELYLKHLKPNGLLAFQVTNRLLDLVSVVAKHSEHHSLHGALIRQTQTVYSEVTPSAWFLMTGDDRLLEEATIREAKETYIVDPSVPLWTDNFHNLFQILRPATPPSTSSRMP